MERLTMKTAITTAAQLDQTPKTAAAECLKKLGRLTHSTKEDTAWIRKQLESRSQDGPQEGPDEIDQLCIRVRNIELILNTMVEAISNLHGDQQLMIQQQNETITFLKSLDAAFALISKNAD